MAQGRGAHAGISRSAEETTGEDARAETAGAGAISTFSAASSDEGRNQPAENQLDGGSGLAVAANDSKDGPEIGKLPGRRRGARSAWRPSAGRAARTGNRGPPAS
jgi:hypothetical protein